MRMEREMERDAAYEEREYALQKAAAADVERCAALEQAAAADAEREAACAERDAVLKEAKAAGHQVRVRISGTAGGIGAVFVSFMVLTTVIARRGGDLAYAGATLGFWGIMMLLLALLPTDTKLIYVESNRVDVDAQVRGRAREAAHAPDGGAHARWELRRQEQAQRQAR